MLNFANIPILTTRRASSRHNASGPTTLDWHATLVLLGITHKQLVGLVVLSVDFPKPFQKVALPLFLIKDLDQFCSRLGSAHVEQQAREFERKLDFLGSIGQYSCPIEPLTEEMAQEYDDEERD